MTDTTTLAPTDAEIMAIVKLAPALETAEAEWLHVIRTILAKWGAPAPASDLEKAVRKLHAARGRYHNQIAACDLYDLLGLPNFRPGQEPEPPAQEALLNPDMPTQELRLHMGELTTDEVLVARAAIRWANSQQEAQMPLSDEHLYRLWRDCYPCNKHGASWHYGRAIEAAHGIGITAAQKETP